MLGGVSLGPNPRGAQQAGGGSSERGEQDWAPERWDREMEPKAEREREALRCVCPSLLSPRLGKLLCWGHKTVK